MSAPITAYVRCPDRDYMHPRIESFADRHAPNVGNVCKYRLSVAGRASIAGKCVSKQVSLHKHFDFCINPSGRPALADDAEKTGVSKRLFNGLVHFSCSGGCGQPNDMPPNHRREKYLFTNQLLTQHNSLTSKKNDEPRARMTTHPATAEALKEILRVTARVWEIR